MEQNMNIYLAWPLTIAYYIVWPVYLVCYYLFWAVLLILAPITRVLLFLLQPVLCFIRIIGVCIVAPFHFFAKFETLYIYFGVASLTGLAIGLLLHFSYDFLYSSLKLASEPPLAGPTAKQYRQARRRAAKLEDDALLSPTSLAVSDTPGRGRRGLLAQTIHEEDSDF